MSTFAAGGGKIDQEGFLKFLLHMFRTGYSRGMNVTQRGAGANMSVDVNVDSSSFAGVMVQTSAGVPYYGWEDATTNTTVNTSDPSNPRIDTVVAYIDLSLITSATTNNNGALKYKAVPGTAAGSPTAPSGATIQASIGAGNPYVTLANLAVGTGVGSIVNANITDTRNPMAFQVPYLYGGASNTNGHLVPNIADDTIALLAAAQTLTNKLLSTGTTFGNNLVTGNALATSAIKLGYAEITSNFSPGTTAETDVTGVSVAVTVPAGGRDVKITIKADCYNSGGADQITLKIKESTTVLDTAQVLTTAINKVQTCTFSVRLSAPSSGSHTYKLSIAGGVANPNIQATSTEKAYILVEAI